MNRFGGHYEVEQDDNDGVCIAQAIAGTTAEDTEANARLIAAAPGLLAYAECQRIYEESSRPWSHVTEVNLVETIKKHGFTEGFTMIGCRTFLAKLRDKAIAKATGGTP